MPVYLLHVRRNVKLSKGAKASRLFFLPRQCLPTVHVSSYRAGVF